MELIVKPPVRLNDKHRTGMVATVYHCTVHSTLRQPIVSATTS